MTNQTKARAEAKTARAEAFAAQYGGREEYPKPRSERDRQAFHAGADTIQGQAGSTTMVMSPWNGRLMHVLEYPAHIEEQRENMATYFAALVLGEGVEVAVDAIAGAGSSNAAEEQVPAGVGV